MIKPYLTRWWTRITKSFIKNFPASLISIILIPFFIWTITIIIASYGTIAAIAYTASCIWKLDKLLEKFWRVAVWGVGYLIGAIALGELITKLPEISKGEGISIFTGFIVLAIIIFAYWLKKR